MPSDSIEMRSSPAPAQLYDSGEQHAIDGSADNKLDESLLDSPIVADNAYDDQSSSPKLPISRVIPNTSIYKSAFHIFKCNVGTGIFLLASVYNDAGWVMGPILAIFCGGMVIDTTMMLLRAKKKINRDEVQTYPQVVGFVLGNVWRMAVTVAIVTTQLGFCLMYLQFIGGLGDSIFDFNQAYKVYVLAAALCAFPMTLMSNNLSVLAVASMVATGCVFFTIIGTMVELAGELRHGVNASHIAPVASPLRWVLYIASSMSVLEGIAMVLPVENACREKEKVAPMIKIVLSLIVLLYIFYALMGYLAYGDTIKVSVVNVMPDNVFTDVLRVALAINLLCTFAVQFVPAIQIIDHAMKIEKHRVTQSSRAVVARVMLTSVLAVLAMLIGAETIGLMLALVGSIAATLIAVVVPALLELQVDYAVSSTDKRSGWAYFRRMFATPPYCSFVKARCFVYVVVGVTVMIVGTVTCIIDASHLGQTKHGDTIDGLKNETSIS